MESSSSSHHLLKEQNNNTEWLEDGEIKAIPKDLIKGKTLVATIHEPTLLEESFQNIEIRGNLQDTLLTTLPGHLTDKLAMNDLERESVFMEQTSQSVSQVIKTLCERGIPYRRPDDYFAEMVKDDKHMGKIEERLMAEKERLERIQRKKEEREAAKLSKQLQLEREKEKKQKTKQFQENVEQLKKQRKKNSDKTMEYWEEEEEEDDDFPVELLEVEEMGAGKRKWSATEKKKKPKVAISRGIVKKRKPKGRYFSKNKPTRGR
ncbi:Probable rRNA-processing protein EBP2 [Galdieria sulphuraria]|uniref:rRNA processing protein-related protein isoform 1 n=1 Tax=Galdieria sulphuraria TaxID=130081 RepID=M2VTW1_GALSU|nr:rRNA processing protein-related protein isoform 2 [Galdieria sulphuraria]XP_005703161.1 rRNA processing protein-related protein isoform 1 [Galdieria sulphuraria]EME26640.1 rRNA processing protein-related protein isoform 2 [Galdieria sulphuraria]EME26641.1 rRNA processing protein-related protein isoform 1 [Galdieria sulphuraria]GJD08735.1 Probable rRNA-processing protein EBP2 [Galdieria sulphuraria]|eukprot:XP_005703160.1 rRNA processing protein-related protein isoform 2 [Galdieria sulphuraria]